MSTFYKILYIANRIILRFLLFFSNEYNKGELYSRFLGMKIGKNCRIFSRPRFGSEPYLIEIGDDVRIARGVSFITHDGGLTLFRNEFPGINYFAKIKIGNNVLIGLNTIILPGVTIGNNVIIGSCSVINKDIPDNSVVAGIPAKLICDIESYKQKSITKACFISEKNYWKRKKEILSFVNNNVKGF